MRKNDNNSGKSSRTPSDRGSRRPAERNSRTSDRKPRSSGNRKRTGSDSSEKVATFGDRRSSEWSTGDYRETKKGTVKGRKKPWEHEGQDSRGYKARESTNRRDEDNRGNRGSANRRDEDNRSNRGSTNRRDEDNRSNRRRSEEPRSEGYRSKKPRGPVNKRFDNYSPKIDSYKKQERMLDNNQNEEDEGEYRIQGRNPVFEAMRSGRPLNKLFVEKDKDDTMISRIVAIAREKNIPIQYLERNKLDSLSQSRIHQGVILELAAKEYVEVEDIIMQAAEKGEQPFVLVLDEITDTNNFGSIIRSAECAGVHGIIISKRRSATLNTTVAKVAAGAMEYVPVARVSNLVQALRQLKEKGLWIIGADMEGEHNYYDADLKGPCALVIGSEGKGLARLVKSECDLMVKIPMKGKISSLNAGVAAALIMFEISKQRG